VLVKLSPLQISILKDHTPEVFYCINKNVLSKKSKLILSKCASMLLFACLN